FRVEVHLRLGNGGQDEGVPVGYLRSWTHLFHRPDDLRQERAPRTLGRPVDSPGRRGTLPGVQRIPRRGSGLRWVSDGPPDVRFVLRPDGDRKSTRLNSSHVKISYAVFCLK